MATARDLAAFLEAWQLTPDGEPRLGATAAVLSVRTRSGAPATLKVGAVDAATEHEHLALTRWEGRGAVRLLRAEPRRGALLLERLDGSLRDSWDVEACEIVGSLYGDLHRPTGAPFRSLSAVLGPQIDRLAVLPRSAPLPHRMVEQAVGLGRAFLADASTDGVLVHTDLHYDTVLGHPDGGWRAVDPKPLSGDPHWEPAPLLWNRFEEVAGAVRDGVRRRFHAVVDASELDEDRARAWVVVRMMTLALDALAGVEVGPHSAAEWPTVCIAVAKAVQD